LFLELDSAHDIRVAMGRHINVVLDNTCRSYVSSVQ